MGLSLYYQWQFQGEGERPRQVVQRLYQFAQSLRPQQISEFLVYEGADCVYREDDPEGDLKLSALHPETGQSPQQIVGFRLVMRPGCDQATLGLAHYGGDQWQWSSACDTYGASAPQYGGLDHFLEAHRLFVKVLDAAKQLGIAQEVVDEGGYWLNRDEGELKAAAVTYGELMASLGDMSFRL